MNHDVAFTLPARAKLNLELRVVGRRDDGYHLLDTLFHAIELHDDLVLAPAAEGITLHVTADRTELAVDPGSDNLVSRALARFVAATGHRGGFRARLHKRIPHGAGLGGGSSDAAAALRLANHLTGAGLDRPALAQLATGLGADVPFFLVGGSQRGRGIGDVLTPAPVPPLHFVLLVPPFGCPTKAVYENHAALWKSGGQKATVRAVTGPNTRDSGLRIEFCNDLSEAAERVRPELAELRRRVVDLGRDLGLEPRDVAMTGSGSTLFTAHASEHEAMHVVERLRGLETDGVRVMRTRSAANSLDVPTRVTS